MGHSALRGVPRLDGSPLDENHEHIRVIPFVQSHGCAGYWGDFLKRNMCGSVADEGLIFDIFTVDKKDPGKTKANRLVGGAVECK